jgi:hypothetical protein
MSEQIRLEVRQSGGFAALSRETTADTQSLPADQADELRSLVAGLDLDALSDPAAPAPGGPASGRGARSVPDAATYELSLTCGPRSWRATYSDPQVPAELRPLLRWAQRRARPSRPAR